MGEWEKLIMTVNLFGTPKPLPHPSTASCGYMEKGREGRGEKGRGGRGGGKGGIEGLG